MRIHVPRAAALPALALLAAVALVAAGCGDSDTTTSDSTAAAPEPSSGGETVSISETDFALTPADVTVKPGSITFDVSNDGDTVHNLEVEAPDGDSELEGDLEPGASGQLTVDLSEPGTYTMYCPVGDHQGMGMEGQITVEG